VVALFDRSFDEEMARFPGAAIWRARDSEWDRV